MFQDLRYIKTKETVTLFTSQRLKACAMTSLTLLFTGPLLVTNIAFSAQVLVRGVLDFPRKLEISI